MFLKSLGESERRATSHGYGLGWLRTRMGIAEVRGVLGTYGVD